MYDALSGTHRFGVCAALCWVVSEREDWKTDIDYLEELLAKVESEEGVS